MATAPRLSASDRRQQLLDTAVALVVTQGAGAVTMERLAEQAGVSKALPYLHFENADAVLAAVYEIEVAHIGRKVRAGMAEQTEPADKITAAVHAYFDAVADRGAVFTALSARPTWP